MLMISLASDLAGLACAPLRMAAEQAGAAQHDQHRAGADQQQPEPGVDVIEVLVGDQRDPQRGAAEQYEEQVLRGPGHSSHHPTSPLTATATAKVRGANRIANRRPNTPACSAINLMSTIGPTTRNASLAVGEN